MGVALLALAAAPAAVAGTLNVVRPQIGTITGPGINCGPVTSPSASDCSQSFATAELPVPVVLSTQDIVGYAETWSSCSPIAPLNGQIRCLVAVGAGTVTVSITHTPVYHDLVVVKQGDGAGTVSGGGTIDCGVDCSETLHPVYITTLTATPEPGSVFVSWSGCTAVVDGNCRIELRDGPITVVATFALVTYALTVLRSGTGTGTVTSAPAGILCGADCEESYVGGELVTLTAAAAPGSTFVGMSGSGCTGTQVTCTVTMDAAKTVTATFGLGESAGAGGDGGAESGGVVGGGGIGAEVDEEGDTAVDADLIGVKAVKTLLGKRVLKVELEAGEKLEVVLELLRKGKVIARKRIASFRAGHRVVNWVLGKRLAGGRARLQITLEDATGNELDFARRVRIAPRL